MQQSCSLSEIITSAFISILSSLNNRFVSNIYVGDDGKLHKVQGGADSVLPFSSKPLALYYLTTFNQSGTGCTAVINKFISNDALYDASLSMPAMITNVTVLDDEYLKMYRESGNIFLYVKTDRAYINGQKITQDTTIQYEDKYSVDSTIIVI